jgi:hypothetical protein
LINGEVVIFCDEDYKNNIQNNKVNEKNYKEYFISEIKTAFYEIDFNKEEYESALGKVEDYYKKQLKELEEKGIEEKKEKLFYIREEFTSRCKRLCKALLEMPWEEQEWGFTLNDKWFKGGDIRDENGKIIGKFKCLKDIYNNINKLFEKIMEELNYSNSEIREAWESFEKNVNMFYPANIDYFLEVSPNSILGICSNITEIDCFSVKNLFPEKQEIKLESLSKKENIKVLLEKGILNEKDFSIEENYLTSHDVENMMNNIFDRMKGFVLKDKNYFNYSSKEMKNNIKKVIGYTMRDESYQDKMKKEIKLSKKIKEIIKKTFNLNIDLEVFYYNIIDVLDDVRKKQEEIVQGLIK